AGLLVHPIAVPEANFPVALPMPTLGFIHGLPIVLREYIPLALPFAILTVIGGIDVTESARVAGDDYETRDILLTEAIATLVAGLFGGVSQSTPYIGHPAYKAMGGRAAYTLACGIFIGLGGMLGYIPVLVKLLPLACLAPILIFVAFDIVGQAFGESPRSHAPAVCFAIFPSVAQLLLIVLGNVNPALLAAAFDPRGVAEATKVPLSFVENAGVFIILAHGFILTGMLWGAALAFMISRQIRQAATVLVVLAGLSFFGVIHSILPTGGIYFPWSASLNGSHLPYHWTAAYLAFALMVVAFGSMDRTKQPALVETERRAA